MNVNLIKLCLLREYMYILTCGSVAVDTSYRGIMGLPAMAIVLLMALLQTGTAAGKDDYANSSYFISTSRCTTIEMRCGSIFMHLDLHSYSARRNKQSLVDSKDTAPCKQAHVCR